MAALDTFHSFVSSPPAKAHDQRVASQSDAFNPRSSSSIPTASSQPPTEEQSLRQRQQERGSELGFVADYATHGREWLSKGGLAAKSNTPPREMLGRSSPALRIEDFELIKTLGTGTFARVWLARLQHGTDEERQRVFALKILRKVDVIRLKQVEHVRNERSTLSAVAGFPFIPTLITTFADHNRLYMLLDYCPGGEVFTYLRRARRFPEAIARFYAAEIVLILEYLHDHQGIAYRDLKPENILLDAQGHIKLVDFGFAKQTGKTETYTLCGTPEYLAPEVIRNTGHGMAVDWWALGILLYEFLVGQPPFWDSNPMKIYHKIVEGNIPFPPEPTPQQKCPECVASHAAGTYLTAAQHAQQHAPDKDLITMSRTARDLITHLCATNPSQRLGYIAGGSARVRAHDFFQGVDWEALYAREQPGPIVPRLRHAADATNFDAYDEPPPEDTAEPYTAEMAQEHEWAFCDF